MADKQIKVDIKQTFYDLTNEIEKECGEWKSLPETEEDRILKKKILDKVERLFVKEK